MNYEYDVVSINMKSMVKFASSFAESGSCRSKIHLCPIPSRKEIAEDKP